LAPLKIKAQNFALRYLDQFLELVGRFYLVGKLKAAILWIR